MKLSKRICVVCKKEIRIKKQRNRNGGARGNNWIHNESLFYGNKTYCLDCWDQILNFYKNRRSFDIE